MANQFAINQIEDCLKQKNTEYFNQLISLKSIGGISINLKYFNYLTHRNPNLHKLINNLSELIRFGIKNDQTSKYKSYCNIINDLIEITESESDPIWLMPVIKQGSGILTDQAIKLHKKHGPESDQKFLENAADVLMGCFRLCSGDLRGSYQNSKKQGILYISNNLFKIYFAMNNLHLCKPIIRAIDSPGVDLAGFPNSEITTFKFYCGQKAIYDGNLSAAYDYFCYAFENCPEKYVSNKRLILFLLVPLKMLTGIRPTRELLQKYNLHFLCALIDAIESGEIAKYHSELNSMEDLFIKHGIYLLYAKLKLFVVKNLFMHVQNIQQSHQIRIQDLKIAFNFSKTKFEHKNGHETTPMDYETNCFLVNLIALGLMKGYLSEKHQMLVLSKANPFPVSISLEQFEVGNI